MTAGLAEFDLEIEPTKTALLRFGSQCLKRARVYPPAADFRAALGVA